MIGCLFSIRTQDQQQHLFKYAMSTAAAPRLTISNPSQEQARKISAFKTETVKQNAQLLSEEVDKIRKISEKLTEINNQLQLNKATCQATINNLKTEIKQLQAKVGAYERETNSTNYEFKIKEEVRHLGNELKSTCANRVKLANELNVKKLKKIDIDQKKSLANEVFKWAIVSIYNEPESKYFWLNFKEQAFEQDKGVDFMERLGKIFATKEEHKLKTEHFLANEQEILNSAEFKDCKDEVYKIRDIAKLFRQSYKLVEEIKQKQALIQKHKQSTLEKDEEAMRWKTRAQALKDRIEINQSYLKLLNETQGKIAPKIASYSGTANSAEGLRKEFESIQQWSPTITLDQDHKSNCQCRIF